MLSLFPYLPGVVEAGLSLVEAGASLGGIGFGGGQRLTGPVSTRGRLLELPCPFERGLGLALHPVHSLEHDQQIIHF